MEERIQKIISAAGLCSRRTAEEWIRGGDVTINGRIARIGDKADGQRDCITVRGKTLRQPERMVYVMLYKPIGVVTTLRDERGRKTVADLVSCGVRVHPVGRLDYQSEGLLLLTNDGSLTNKLTHPRHTVEKRYLTVVTGNVKNLQKLSQPMKIDGYPISPAAIEIVCQKEREATVILSIHEGRNRQIRKMCALCGFQVRRLKRIAVGELKLDETLSPGAWRYLTKQEIQYLKALPEIL